MINIRDKKFIKEFGLNLRNLRKERGLSQEQLANLADIPITQIGRIERGEINTTISTIKTIADALNVHPQKLLGF